jgi:hypothetical protein
MQNSWEKSDTSYGDDKMEMPYQDGYTNHSYRMPDTMSTAPTRKSAGGNYSVNGSINQLAYPTPSFSSQTVIVPNETTAPSEPCFARLCIRIWQIIASFGTFAFQAGAPAVRKVDYDEIWQMYILIL